MRTIQTTVYSFEELSPEAQQKAIDSLRDINTEFDWWEFVYEDAREVKIEIKSFDIYRGQIKITASYNTPHLIIKNHGATTETYKTAKNYLDEVATIKRNSSEDDDNGEEMQTAFEHFEQQIAEDYLILLRNEYEYRGSDEAIKETIEANEYEFTEGGKLI